MYYASGVSRDEVGEEDIVVSMQNARVLESCCVEEENCGVGGGVGVVVGDGDDDDGWRVLEFVGVESQRCC